jgi:hypothetical protein
MTKQTKQKTNFAEIVIFIGLVLTPVILVWRLLNFDEPNGIYEYIINFILITITGCGGLGIGLLLGKKWIDVMGETK